ncbi:MAG: DUF2202 domain-containing protein [Ignavibacteriaceae bacterium]|nr:DUF2202 domain-containing protein [Ignavibacteriaceae bacterium]
MNAKKILAVMSFLLIAIFLMACNQESQVITPDDLSLQKKGQVIDLEAEGLIYMRLAEKLARDVYTTLGAEEGSYPAFLNIASSEQNYMDQILGLLDKYEIPDPLEENNGDVIDEVGEFLDEDFEALYITYIGYDDPLQAGIEIEGLIIAYLEAQLADVVEKLDISYVYTCLLASSRKHLQSFDKENYY